MIYTFYSYKGGVGRTMALANAAELFYRAGNRVLMIDWDLEAPGLEQFFFSPEELPQVRQQRGIIDLVLAYKEQMKTKLDLADPENLPFEHPRRVAQAIYPRQDRKGAEALSSSGQLWLITPGQRSEKTPGAYAQAVLNFNWVDFYTNWAGEVYIDWLRRQCSTFADVILIDSRTGVTEMGGVCTYHLADVVVLFCAANNQNIQGTLEMLRNFAPADPDISGNNESKLLQQRGWRPLKTLVVPARIDRDNPDLLDAFERQLAPLASQSEVRNDLIIPYISRYSFQEQVAVTAQEARSPDLIDAYTRLVYALGEKGEQLREAWERRIAKLQQELSERDTRQAEFKIQRTLETRTEEKTRIDGQMEEIAKQRRQIEEELGQLQREMQYYHIKQG